MALSSGPEEGALTVTLRGYSTGRRNLQPLGSDPRWKENPDLCPTPHTDY